MSTQSFWQFIVEQHEKLMGQVIQHLGLTFLSLFLAILVGLPLGILIARKRKLSNPVLGIAGILQTIPSIALLGFMIPAFGIGATPAIVALLIYALLFFPKEKKKKALSSSLQVLISKFINKNTT